MGGKGKGERRKEKGERRKECALQGQKNSARGNTLGKGERRKGMRRGQKRKINAMKRDLRHESPMMGLDGTESLAAHDAGAMLR